MSAEDGFDDNSENTSIVTQGMNSRDELEIYGEYTLKLLFSSVKCF